MKASGEKPKVRRPKGTVGWMVVNGGGVLYTCQRYSQPARVKRLFSDGGKYSKQRVVAHLPGVVQGDKQRYFVSAIRIGANGIVLFIRDTAMIVDVHFHIADGEVCVIQQEGPFRIVKKKVEAPPKPVTQPVASVVVPQKPKLMRHFFFVEKRVPNVLMHTPRCAVEFYNDGKHLYVKENGALRHLLFRCVEKEVATVFLPGMHFLDNVLFRSYGHTLSGNVVVSLREVSNSWAITLSIAPNHAIAVDEMYSRIGVRKVFP